MAALFVTVQMSLSGMVVHTVVHPHHGMQFSSQKVWTIDAHKSPEGTPELC